MTQAINPYTTTDQDRELAEEIVRQCNAIRNNPCPPFCDGIACMGRDHSFALPDIEGTDEISGEDGWISMLGTHYQGEYPMISLSTDSGPEAGNGISVRFPLDQAEAIAAQLVATVAKLRGTDSGIPVCPPWCSIDHDADPSFDLTVGSERTRLHTVQVGAGVKIDALDDLVTGARSPAQITVDAEGLSGAAASALISDLIKAVQMMSA